MANDPKPRVLANAAGNRSTPCQASLAEPEMTGYEAAKNSYRVMKTLVQYPLHAFSFPEWEVGREGPPLARRGGPKVRDRDGKLAWLIRWFPEPKDEEDEPDPVEKLVTPTEVVTTILARKLKPIAEATAPNCPHGAVVTIPSDASKLFCSALCFAVTKAGFTVRQVIRASAAAALSYGLDDPTQPGGSP